MKKSLESFPLVFSQMLVILLSLNIYLFNGSCGTEVGNGHSGPDGDGGMTNQSKKQPQDPTGNVDNQANNDNTVSLPSTESQGNESMIDYETATDLLNSNIGVIFAECGSLFGEKINSPISIFIEADPTNNIGQEAIFSATLANDKWTIKRSETALFSVNQSSEKYKVSLLDKDNLNISTGYRCGKVLEDQEILSQEEKSVIYETRTVLVNNKDIQRKVVWYLRLANDSLHLAFVDIYEATGGKLFRLSNSEVK